MAERDNQNTNSNDPGKDRKTCLKERELALKEKEIEAKIKLDKQGLWFTSPLFIGVITAISGLIGTGIGAILQGNATVNLERLKFEYALIQKALELPTQAAAAKQLLFLIDSGVIKSLDGAKLKTIAKNPSQLPVFVPNTATSRETFFDNYTTQFGPISPEGKTALTQIFSFIEKDKDIQDIRYVAYILATLKHETSNTYQTFPDYGARSYFDKYDAGTAIGKRLGNIEKGDGFRFRGRGYGSILTGRANYQRFNNALGLAGTESDLINNPDMALDPQISYRILSIAMREGYWTGKKLSDFINSDKVDYDNARRIVNGLDQAKRIAEYAKKFEIILRESLNPSNAN